MDAQEAPVRRALGILAIASFVFACTRPPPRELGPVVIAATPPPAIRGGGLLLLANGNTLVVSDADRDRVVLFDLTARTSLAIILDAGSAPGRAIESPDGLVHVLLHGSGALLRFPPASPADRDVQPICPMPSGITYDDVAGLIRVACASGEIASYGATAPRVRPAIVLVERDLRDIFTSAGRVFVTSFRSAQLLEVEPQFGTIVSRTTIGDVTYVDATSDVPFRASVAWRAIAVPGAPGRLLLLHQRMRRLSIAVRPRFFDGGAPDGAAPDAGVLRGAYDQPVTPPTSVGTGELADSDECAAIVRSSVTLFDLRTTPPTVVRTAASLTHARLAVDVAVESVDPTSSTHTFALAFANAGVGDASGGVGFAEGDLDHALAATGACASLDRSMGIEVHAATAVAMDRAGGVIAFEREPAAIVYRGVRTLLGGRSVFDTGHALFHTATSAHIACASCHPVGREDGQLWTFDGLPRRTQSLAGGLLATAPFHWEGEERSMREVVDDVFTQRMRGAALDDEHVAALAAWLDQLPAPHGTASDATSAALGRLVFTGSGGCTQCHSGPRFTDNQMHDVGHGLEQVPSLVGVSFRLPLMRSGCGRTTAERFSPSCAGAMHGTVFSSSDVPYLVAYLDSL